MNPKLFSPSYYAITVERENSMEKFALTGAASASEEKSEPESVSKIFGRWKLKFLRQLACFCTNWFWRNPFPSYLVPGQNSFCKNWSVSAETGSGGIRFQTVWSLKNIVSAETGLFLQKLVAEPFPIYLALGK